MGERQLRSVNICVLGSSCGKTALITRFLSDGDTLIHQPTIIARHSHMISFQGQAATVNIVEIGSECQNIVEASQEILNANIFMFVFNVTSLPSLQQIYSSQQQIETVYQAKSQRPSAKYFLVGNQLDALEDGRQLVEDGQVIAGCLGAIYALTSAKTGLHVSKLFYDAVSAALDMRRLSVELDGRQGTVQEFPLGKPIKKASYYILSSQRIRHLSLERHLLHCSCDEPGEQLKMTLSLIGANVNLESRDGVSFVRVRTSDGIAYGFYGKTEQETAEWLNVLVGATTKSHVFGAPLERYINAPTDNVALVVKRCIDFLTLKSGHKAEGIFRLSGSLNTVAKIRRDFNEFAHAMEIHPSQDVHAVASLLKQYLRDLPIPLFPEALHNALVRIQKDSPNIIDKCASYHRILKILPPVYTCTIKYLLGYLSKVQSHQELNKMNANNLATMLGPNAFRTDAESPIEVFEALKTQVQVLRDLIENHDMVFPQEEIDKQKSPPASQGMRSLNRRANMDTIGYERTKL
eukprot:TRINITY_DN8055_c0_g1_i5.p1 TRINITY_DN8055_c0_g1~~TRINITY_DN8055_c0_g1_i5.p1  ORF type:complete len:521 (-),score=91.39 TRINITY_DN8055_c0_g1_i5:179-1741(-)